MTDYQDRYKRGLEFDTAFLKDLNSMERSLVKIQKRKYQLSDQANAQHPLEMATTPWFFDSHRFFGFDLDPQIKEIQKKKAQVKENIAWYKTRLGGP